MLNKFNQSNYHQICDELASADTDLAAIIKADGYPTLWSRPVPGTVHQQQKSDR